MQNEFNEETKTQSEETTGEDSFVYKAVMKGDSNRRTFSVVSLILSVLSVLLFVFPWVGIILGFIGVGLSLLSRKNLGYFDGLALAGLIVGIFGIVFALAGFIVGDLIVSIFF